MPESDSGASDERGVGARGVGRPRDRAADRRLLEVALGQLGSVGFAAMSLTTVADLAGSTKPALYRRWSNKLDLVRDALEIVQPGPAPPWSGDTRADLQSALAYCAEDEDACLLGALWAERDRHPELLAGYERRVGRRYAHALRAILEGAAARGELQADADLALATRILLATVRGLARAGESDGALEAVADFVLDAVAEPGRRDRAPRVHP